METVFDSNTPDRGCGLTRVKYEMVSKYLSENGFQRLSRRVCRRFPWITFSWHYMLYIFQRKTTSLGQNIVLRELLNDIIPN